MSDPPLKALPGEHPLRPVDPSSETEEETTLEKRAKSPALRAEFEHDKHLEALNARLEVIQAKLDAREDELRHATPRMAKLEQSERSAKGHLIVETLGSGGGAALLGVASFVEDATWKFLWFGVGLGLVSLALVAKVSFAVWGWPKPRVAPSKDI